MRNEVAEIPNEVVVTVVTGVRVGEGGSDKQAGEQEVTQAGVFHRRKLSSLCAKLQREGGHFFSWAGMKFSRTDLASTSGGRRPSPMMKSLKAWRLNFAPRVTSVAVRSSMSFV